MNSMAPSPQHRASPGRWSALLVLLVALAATLFGVGREYELARRGQLIRLQDSIAQLQPMLASLLGQPFEILRSQAKATLRRDNFSETGWNDFVATSEWQQRFPGMLEIGCAMVEGDRCSVKFVASRGAAPWHPAGFDLNSNLAIGEAIRRSAEAGYGIASREIALGPDTNADRAIIGLLPLAAKDLRPGVAETNRENLRGFVFFALDQRRYFEFILPQLAGLPVQLRLLSPDEAIPARTATQRLISDSGVAGEWRFAATMKESMPGASAPQWIVLLGGTALSFLLYFLFATQGRLRFEAESANKKIVQRETEITALNRDLEAKITARTAELREANERLARFKAVIETTSDLVGMTSLDGGTIYLNQAGRRMMELPDDFDVTTLPMARFYPDDVNRFFNEVAIPQAMRDGFWAGETRLRTRLDREIPVSFVGLVVKSDDGTPLHLACIARDISEGKRTEAEMERALAEEKELNRLKSSFISMVTHEIRTPLALILGSSEILSRYLDRLLPDKRAEHLRTIDSAVQRMGALVEDVLLFSKAEAGRMEFNPIAMDLNDFCAQLVDEISSTTNRRCPIERELAGISQPARGDEILLRHIFANLLANAAKYSPPGAPVKFSVTRDGGAALFTVRDRGMGIPEADQKRLFTPFYRGRNAATLPGTGLGLVIVKHCVERHGGKIAIESAENLGTTVTVTLPLFSPAHTDFLNRLAREQENETNLDH